MEINIKDYLTESEIKEIVIDEFRNSLRNHLRDEKEVTRIISNAPYYKLYEVVDENLPDGYKETIKNKVTELINSIDSYHVFRYDYTTRKAENIGSRIVEEAIVDNKELIKENVQKVINNSDDIYNRFVDSFLYTIDSGFTIKINKGDD